MSFAILVLVGMSWIVGLAVFCVYHFRPAHWKELGPLGAVALAVCWGIALFTPHLFLQVIMLVPLILLCARRTTPMAYAVLSLGVTVMVLAYSRAQMQPELKQKHLEYPHISVADRLAYERTGPAVRRVATDRKAVADSHLADSLLAIPAPMDAIEKELVEQLEWRDFRNRTLQGLHEGVVAGFIGTQGFGEARMADLYRSLLSWRRGLHPVPQLNSSSLGSVSADVDAIPRPRARDWPELDLGDLQFNTLIDFVNVPGQGYFISRERVIGFQSHGLISPHHPDRKDRRDGSWNTERIELVSLLKHDLPGVYLSKYLPAMDQLRDAKVRPLDRFEESALARLYGGEDLIARSTTTHIRMLGSIRALKQCLECHSVQAGELLGAFSYHLRRPVAAEPEAPWQRDLDPAPPGDRSDKPVL